MNRDDENEFIDIDSDDNENDDTTQLPAIPSSRDPTPTEIPSEPIDPPLTFHHDMDDRSRELIQQMLAEEEYYYGTDTLATMSSRSKRKTHTPKKQKIEARSSASLPSHKTRWASDEDDRLRDAIEKHGYGNWKAIANDVKTRNPLQCKNRARHWASSEKVEKGVKTVASNDQDTSATTSEHVVEHSPADGAAILPSEVSADAEEASLNDDDDEDISITEGSDDQEMPDIQLSDEVDVKSEESEEQHGTETVEMELAAATPEESDAIIDQDLATAKTEDTSADNTETMAETKTEDDGVGEDLLQFPAQTMDHGLQHQVLHEHKMDDDDETQRLLMTQEHRSGFETVTQFDRHSIGDDERINNPEWFKNKASKTPDRYLKIRNHLLDAWNACQPRYLTKTSARKGLKDCGDVNAIGRVHEYLESVGAINIGCVNNAPRPPRRVSQKTYDDEDTDMFAAADLVIGYEGPRKRKVRNEHGEWVDPKELEGRVIEHGVPKDQARPRRIIKRPKHYNADEFARGYDPFQLVPVEYYNDEDPAPFIVEITSDALLIMDFHSHLAHTEIIGLLGGSFDARDGVKILRVQSVFPCRSTSTGIQCEMDPESEMKAREFFAGQGYGVVGWYHSHPTFEPQPSIRDIENQTSYQTLFRHQDTGDEPFIGVIVTPYDPEIVSDHSLVQYLHISPRWNETNHFRVPYACRRNVIQTERVSPSVMKAFDHLMDEFKDYEHKVSMHEIFHESRTRLDKLLDSLRANLFLPSEEVVRYIDHVRQLIIRYDPPGEEDQPSIQESSNNDDDKNIAMMTTKPATDTSTANTPL